MNANNPLIADDTAVFLSKSRNINAATDQIAKNAEAAP